jgi:hypothetical protein
LVSKLCLVYSHVSDPFGVPQRVAFFNLEFTCIAAIFVYTLGTNCDQYSPVANTLLSLSDPDTRQVG